jgi:hypothetical protein
VAATDLFKSRLICKTCPKILDPYWKKTRTYLKNAAIEDEEEHEYEYEVMQRSSS